MVSVRKITFFWGLFTRYKQWVIIFFSLFIIGLLFQKTLNPLIDERAMILEDTFFIYELQDTILDTISISQAQEIHNFDTLNTQIRALQDILQEIQQSLAIQATPLLKAELTILLKLAQQQTDMINRFKTNHSVLHNSRAYFPTAFDRCMQTLEEQAELNSVFKDLLQKTFIAGLMFGQNMYSNHILDLEERLATLKKNTHSTEACKIFIDHGVLIAEYSPKEQQIQNLIFNLKLDEGIHNFYTLFEETSSQLIADNKTIYFLISLFTIMLLIYIGFTLATLYRANQALENTLANLSKQQALFTALVKANSAITQANDKTTLYKHICEIATGYNLFDNCWIGEVQTNQSIVPIAYAGIDTDIFSKLNFSTESNIAKDQGTVQECITSKKPVITNDYIERIQGTVLSELGQKRGIQGCASFPIMANDKAVACLVVYTQQMNFFNAQNSELLQQLVNDIGITLKRFKLEQERIQYQQDLAISSIAFESHESIMIADATGKIVKCNKAFTLFTGYSEADIIGKTPSLLKSGLHDALFYKKLWKSIDTTGSWQGEIWNRKKDGTLYPTWQSISSVFDVSGKVTHYISHALDLTRDKESEHQISYLNNHDNLTKLPNRSLLIDRLEHQLAQKNTHYSFLLLININRFKMLNDSLGHSGGDELLKQVSARIDNFQFNDVHSFTVARVGNDEFIVLCITEHNVIEKALKLADKITRQLQNELEKAFYIHDKSIVIETCMGVTLFKPEARDPESIMREANTALTRAKQLSKNMVQSSIQFYAEEMQRRSQDRLEMEMQLRSALNNKEFILHYQPQIEVSSGKIIGAESLIRWIKPDGTLVSPAEFIPVLEESALIIPVGLWILEEAITQAKTLNAQLPNMMISVNLSAIQFNDNNLINNVADLLERMQYPACQLELEVTESLLMSDIESTIAKLNAFADLGIKIAIDDFGTGYSSLAYLKRFPVNKLKIDKAFIDDITLSGSSDVAIVKATIQMANALNIRTIAEGVENKEQLTVLTEMGCNEIQGYYFSKPLPFKALIEFIKEFPNAS